MWNAAVALETRQVIEWSAVSAMCWVPILEIERVRINSICIPLVGEGRTKVLNLRVSGLVGYLYQ